ncbi:MAG: hypothetical protein HN948_03550 [Clostridia bacterium]|jgi:hypothetical protein|nr:hypothetical protein [Clostridia bacterium]MBT7122068.1 hypothetical protein [Clostridia bacterium]
MFKSVLELSQQREILSGSRENLVQSIKSGADLRIYTEFRHNEHIDTTSGNNELIKEVSEFRATYLIEDKWCAGIMTLRQPASLPGAFGPRASMSFFMYNMDGTQAIARPFLDGGGPEKQNAEVGCTESLFHDMGRYDLDTTAPSTNFVYDFYSYKFYTNECFSEVYAADEKGNAVSGSLKALTDAASDGAEIKVAISGMCDALCEREPIKHELMIQTGPMYFYTETNYMLTESHPFVRVQPNIPMRYGSGNWDFGWVIARTDGHVAGLWYDPQTLKTSRTFENKAMRWFVKK